MTKLKDKHIREIAIQKLTEEYANDPETIIVNEMGVLHGQSRVDIAVVNGIIHGYEIKSESDTLERLPIQMNDYNKVFDRMTIITQKSHLEEVKNLVPFWWGIWLVSHYRGRLYIRIMRRGRINKNVDSECLSHFLWREEALQILKEKGLHKGYLSKPRSILYNRLAENLHISELKTSITKLLKQREGWKVH